MIWSTPHLVPVAWLPPSPPSASGTESLVDLEALESSALMSLMSFKNNGNGVAAKRSCPYNDDDEVIGGEASQVVSDEESSASRLPPRKRVSVSRRPVAVAAVESASAAAATVPELVSEAATSAPTSLYAEGDEDYINPIHNILRRDILEVFVDTDRPIHNNSNISNHHAPRNARFAVGRVGLRCRFCKHLPPGSSTANLSTIYPETLEGIYRACSVRFQKRHLGICQYIPEAIKAELDILGNEKSCRGSKSYWVESALRLGFKTSPDRKGIIYCPEIK